MPCEESNSLRTQVWPLSLLRLSFVPSSNNYFLSAYCVLGAALGTWYKLGNKTKIPALMDLVLYPFCVRWGPGHKQ